MARRRAGVMTQSERRHQNQVLRWDAVDLSWQKFMRCGVCRRTYCCNNYPDKKPRTRRVRGVNVCAQCWYHPEIDFIVWCLLRVPKDHKKRVNHMGRKNKGGPRP